MASAALQQTDLDRLAVEIRDTHATAISSARTAVEAARACGRLLAEAKALVAHGEWLPWLTANTNVSERTAQKWMRLAKAELPAGAGGIEAALDVIAQPRTLSKSAVTADLESDADRLAVESYFDRLDALDAEWTAEKGRLGSDRESSIRRARLAVGVGDRYMQRAGACRWWLGRIAQSASPELFAGVRRSAGGETGVYYCMWLAARYPTVEEAAEAYRFDGDPDPEWMENWEPTLKEDA